MNDDKIRKWFEDLDEQIADGELSLALVAETRYIEPDLWMGWALSCSNLLHIVYGSRSAFYSAFTEAFELAQESTDLNSRQVRIMISILRSAKNEYLKGYINIDLKISGQILGDLIGLAREAMNSGHLNVAAVLASASLEDALKRYAVANGLNVDDRDMSEVVNALKSKSLIDRSTSKALQPLQKLRNMALHADWDQISDAAVGGLIGFVDTFISVNLSS